MIAIYIFGITPYLLGMLWNCLLKTDKKKFSCVFFDGYLLMFAGFCCEAIICIRKETALSFLSICFIAAITIMNIISLIWNLRQISEGIKNGIENVRKLSVRTKTAILAAGLLTIFSVFLFVPAMDDTVEHAVNAVVTDTMYRYHPYTLEENSIELWNQRYAPIEMLYAVTSSLGKIETAVVIKVIAPFFLLMFFYCSVWRMGELLFEKKKETIPVFFLSVLLISTYPVYSGAEYLEGAILTNSWNGTTLLCCVFLPYAVIHGWYGFSRFGHMKLRERVNFVLQTGVLLLASQLTYIRGAYYVLLIAIIWILIGSIRKGYNYVISRKRD